MLSNKKWLVIITLLLAAALVMSACAPATPPAATEPPAGEETEPPAGEETEPPVVGETPSGIYRVGIFEDITTTNYWGANGPDNTVWNNYVLTPTRMFPYTLAAPRFDFVPVAADGLPGDVVQEGDVWTATFTLRNDITWSDGEALTAADVAFTGNTSLRFGLIAGGWGSWFDGSYLDHIEAVDDTTVKYVFHTKPGMSRYTYGVLQAPILAEHFWADKVEEAFAPLSGLEKPADDASEEDKAAYAEAETAAQNNLYAIEPDGEPLAGTFLFSKWEAGAFAENAANAETPFSGNTVTYYANGAYEVSGAETYNFTLYGEATGDKTLEYKVGPLVESAVYTVYGDQTAAILALKNGEVDFLLNPLGLQTGLLNQVEGDANLTVIRNNVNGFRYLSFNTRRAPMSDVAFRRAVALLIDKEFVTQTILQGVAFPLYSFVPEGNGAWYSTDVEKIGQGLTREERINQAVAELEAAGYSWTGGVKPTWDADNRQVVPGGTLVNPDGSTVGELIMLAPSPGYDPLRSTFAIWIETWLNEAGIPLKAQLQGFNVIVPKIFTEQNFDMYILGWSLTIFPDYLRDFFHSEGAVIDGNNAGGYSNPDFDAASDALLECTTYETCRPIADELQVTLSQELPYVLLFDTGIIETYRSAAVTYPFTDTLSGLQFVQGTPDTVAVK